MLHIRPIVELNIWSGLGAGIAFLIDFWTGADSSILRSSTEFVNGFAAQLTPGWAATPIAASALLLLGACSAFYFRPLSRKGAFAGGFAVISALAIFLP